MMLRVNFLFSLDQDLIGLRILHFLPLIISIRVVVDFEVIAFITAWIIVVIIAATAIAANIVIAVVAKIAITITVTIIITIVVVNITAVNIIAIIITTIIDSSWKFINLKSHCFRNFNGKVCQKTGLFNVINLIINYH